MRKKGAEQAFEELVKEKVVTLKEYGKAKVYLINQDRFPVVDNKVLEGLDDEIVKLKEEYAEMTASVQK